MVYSNELADRIRRSLHLKGVQYLEKRMMGGLCFMIEDKMCVCATKEKLMVRIDPEEHNRALEIPGVQEMNLNGRSMQGFLFISDQLWDSDETFEYWMERALEFNPRAKSSKSKKKTIQDFDQQD